MYSALHVERAFASCDVGKKSKLSNELEHGAFIYRMTYDT